MCFAESRHSKAKSTIWIQRCEPQKKGSKISRAGKIKGSKISLLSDERGRPQALAIEGAGRNDRYAFGSIVKHVPKGCYLVCDKGYDCKRLRRKLRHHGIKPVIPKRQFENGPRRRTPLPQIYRSRWICERTFAWMDKFKRLRIRDERLVTLHKAFWHLACAILYLF